MTGTILLTGGAGYIGSHTYVALVAAGHEVLILDDFSNARVDVPDRLARITGALPRVIRGSVLDRVLLDRIFADTKIDAVVHFAALKAVGDSMARPLDYFVTNIGGLTTLLQAMEAADCRRLVFSSSATVYGIPDETPTPETAPRRAMNPYGWTKIASEKMLEQLTTSDPAWAFGILRYFNPAGAHEGGLIGEDPTDTPNNLMPYIARVATGALPKLLVFGDDYPTPDGTGVRDYIHVEDLAHGHVLSLGRLLETGEGHLVNLGTGRGYSVLEILRAYSDACGRDLAHEIVARRPGDVPIYCAEVGRAAEVLGFRTRRDLADMCRSSWHWVSHPPKTDPKKVS
ncbi:UDP-glucose 4-epimerase GalE [Alterinioella nitratireducens]|uniref:UDP-glucose 4-epimerase GalE n=1 Tax=Alterinioella nitratireducens TaxID=2735915 RepID=UPI001552CBE5|nr:UDP-glucose 4-epimerase GalE [Alterinioella nitratireducens]NPD21298.1 UDP-glucose 4-epimerase GalE [Alterinioella nitratireducens]